MTALITPFMGGKIDFESFKKLIHLQLESGVQGFIINGTTAESPTLIGSEVTELFLVAKKIVGNQVPLIVGTGTNSTANTIKHSIEAEKLGADGILVVVPYYNKPPQLGLFKHFSSVAQAVSLPLIMYNVPSRTITALELETIRKLSEVPNIVGIKEASGVMTFCSEIRESCSSEFTLLSGDDGTYVDFLNQGGNGVISVASHIIPKQMRNWKEMCDKGQVQEAKQDLSKYKTLIDLLFCEANPIPLKWILNRMEIIKSKELRLPLVPLPENKGRQIEAELKKVGLL